MREVKDKDKIPQCSCYYGVGAAILCNCERCNQNIYYDYYIIFLLFLSFIFFCFLSFNQSQFASDT